VRELGPTLHSFYTVSASSYRLPLDQAD
jgi:hypothetical protein